MNEKRKITYREKYQAALAKRAALYETRRIPRPISAPETKFNDSTFSQAFATTGANLSFTGAVNGVSLCLIPQGTTDNTRIGNKILLKNIRIKGSLSVVSNNQTGDRVRVILYKDMQTNGAAAAVTDLLETATVDSFLRMDNVERFKVIKDKYVDLNPPNGTALATSGCLAYVKSFKMNHKANCRIDYSAAAGAITELRTANYAVLMIANVGAGVSNFAGAARVTFTDN